MQEGYFARFDSIQKRWRDCKTIVSALYGLQSMINDAEAEKNQQMLGNRRKGS